MNLYSQDTLQGKQSGIEDSIGKIAQVFRIFSEFPIFFKIAKLQRPEGSGKHIFFGLREGCLTMGWGPSLSSFVSLSKFWFCWLYIWKIIAEKLIWTYTEMCGANYGAHFFRKHLFSLDSNLTTSVVCPWFRPSSKPSTAINMNVINVMNVMNVINWLSHQSTLFIFSSTYRNF